MKNITTFNILLRELWRYEPNILKLIFKFLFVPLYRDNGKVDKYIEAIPEPGNTYIERKAFSEYVNLQIVIISNSVKTIGEWAFDACCSIQS